MSSFVVRKKKLHDGLRVVLLPRHETQTATMLVLIGAGSRYETDQQAGLSHFLEHMFFKGTRNRPTTKDIAETIDNIGGEFNAFTGEEYTGFYVRVAAAQLSTGIDVVADILINPLFPAEEIERERGVIMEEMRMYTDAPMHHIGHLWQRALFGRHPLGRRIDGSSETVKKLRRIDFTRYTKKHYHTRNAVVVLAGNYDERAALQLLRESLAKLPAGRETKPRRAPSALPDKRVITEVRDNIDQTHMVVGVPGLSLNDEKRFAANLLAIILGGGMSSRLFLTVRERHGLAYAVQTGVQSYLDAGSFATQLGARSEQADRALALVMKEYDLVMEEEVSSGELNKAKEMVRGRLLLDLEETNALAQFVGTQELLRHRIDTPQRLMARYNAVNRGQIRELASELLARRKRAVAVLGPGQAVDRVRRALA